MQSSERKIEKRGAREKIEQEKIIRRIGKKETVINIALENEEYGTISWEKKSWISVDQAGIRANYERRTHTKS